MTNQTAHNVFATMVDYLLQKQEEEHILQQAEEIEIYNIFG